MRFATSCFNLDLWLHYVKRFWPLAAAVFLLLLGACALPLMSILGNGVDAASLSAKATDLLQVVTIVLPIACAGLSWIASEMVFRHLHNRRELQFYHGLPLTRTCTFLTCFLAGYALLVVPAILAVICTGAILAIAGATGCGAVLLTMIITGLASALLFFSAAAFAGTVAGNAVGSALIYIALNFTVVVVTTGFDAPVGQLMPGIDLSFSSSDFVYWCTPLLKLPASIQQTMNFGDVRATTGAFSQLPPALGAYAIVGAVLAIAACALYRIRRAETAGDTVTFCAASIICKVLFALVVCSLAVLVSSGLGLTSSNISIAGFIVSMLVFAGIGWIIAEMIVRRTPKVFDRTMMKPCGIFLAALLVVTILVAVDPTGRVSYVPESGEVNSASMTINFGEDITMDADDVARIHQLVLDNKDLLTDDRYAYTTTRIRVDYTLNNGSHLSRSYTMKLGDDEGEMTARSTNIMREIAGVLAKPSYVKQYWFGPEVEQLNKKSYVEGYLTYYASNVDPKYATGAGDATDYKELYGDLNDEDAMTLFEAICADIDEGNMGTIERTYEETTSVADAEYQWRVQTGPQAGTTFPKQANIDITDTMTHTKRWIEKRKAAGLFQEVSDNG